MKYIFTALMVLAAGFAKGQNVNIPDSIFKRFLLNHQPVIDINHDGEIQLSEALAVTELRMGYTYDNNSSAIRDLTGIKSFANLERLYSSIFISTIDLSGMNRLKIFQSDDQSLISANLSGCTSLDTLLFNGSLLLNSINLDSCSNLKFFGCYWTSLQILDVSQCKKINFIDCSHNRITNLNLGTLDSLQTLSCNSNNIETLDLRGCKNLISLNASYNYDLKYLNCNGLKRLATMEDIGGLFALEFIDLTGCNNLQFLSLLINSNKIKSLDLSSCFILNYLYLESAALRHLNLKNGSMLWTTSHISCDTLETLCADDFEIEMLRNTVNLIDRIENANISSYCSFFPGGNYNTIKGKARLNLNGNNCDSTDRAIPNVAVKITDTSGNSLIRYTAPSGDYAHYPYKGRFTLTPYFPYPYFTVNPSSATVTFDTANSITSTKDFCIQPNGIHNDLEITLLPIAFARPGFDAAYTLVYKNRGTTTLSGNVQVNFDNSKMNFTAASPNTTGQNTGQLSWNYNNLQPFESRAIYVTFNLLPPPVNNIGDTVTYLASITPSANDETAFDNSFILPQRVIGSFDPNDKQCLEGSKLDISKIGEYLHYQIHFQNEGTDTAFNVVVADTLSDKLDWNSFELISSSHPVDVKLNNNKAEFIFENIKLPYKAINEPASNGWVAFKIKPTPSVVIGDSLNNKAAIYFDFNKPVITNTATTIVSSVSTPVPVKLEYFSVNSSVNTNILNWKAACSYGSAKFTIERSGDGIHFSSIGNITATSTRCQLPFSFTDNNPVAGKNYYRLKITDADDISFYSKTLIIGNNKAGLEIRAIANDIVYLTSNKQQTIQLKVIAADGKEILNERKMIAAGSNNISLQMKNAAGGIYTLTVYLGEGSIITTRFIK